MYLLSEQVSPSHRAKTFRFEYLTCLQTAFLTFLYPRETQKCVAAIRVFQIKSTRSCRYKKYDVSCGRNKEPLFPFSPFFFESNPRLLQFVFLIFFSSSLSFQPVADFFFIDFFPPRADG